jgi:hypothetical protein
MAEVGELVETLEKLEPMSHGRPDLRKKKPKILAVILDNCTGCAGSPACSSTVRLMLACSGFRRRLLSRRAHRVDPNLHRVSCA